MTSSTHRRRGSIALVLRLLGTAVALYFLWLCLKFAMLSNRLTRDSVYREDPQAASMRSHSAKPSLEDQRARFPLPLYPGAREPEFGEMVMNGRPFHRCDFEVSARPEQVLRYYRDQMAARGWRDITEDAVRRAALADNPTQDGVLDLQNETFLRFYDRWMRTQASFAKWGAHASVAVAEGDRPWLSRVGIHVIEYDSPQQLATELEETLGLGGRTADPDRPATFAQNLGAQQAETTLRTSPQPPDVFCRELVREHVADGWRALELPSRGNRPDDGQAAFLMADNRLLFIQVGFDPDQQISRAVLTKISPRSE